MPTLAKQKLYKWTAGPDGCFKNGLTYAWYIYTDGRNELERIQSVHALNLILLSAKKHGIDIKLLSEISLENLNEISASLNNAYSNDKTQKKTKLFLLKYFYILHQERLSALDLFDLSFSL